MSHSTNIVDKKELQEIQKIASRLGRDEKVIFVASYVLCNFTTSDC
jgi:hypothetical protein